MLLAEEVSSRPGFTVFVLDQHQPPIQGAGHDDGLLIPQCVGEHLVMAMGSANGTERNRILGGIVPIA